MQQAIEPVPQQIAYIFFPAWQLAVHLWTHVIFREVDISSRTSSVATRNINMPTLQWWRHTRPSQGKCPDRNTSALAAALAVKSGNDKIIYNIMIFRLLFLIRLMTCLCPAMSSGLASPLLRYHAILYVKKFMLRLKSVWNSFFSLRNNRGRKRLQRGWQNPTKNIQTKCTHSRVKLGLLS